MLGGSNSGVRSMAKRISIINFKGGVGKTTLAFNVGAGLARYHRSRVLLIDMDHQSSLSIICLGGHDWESAVDEDRTTDEIFRTFIGQRKDMPGTELIINNPLGDAAYESMSVAPASLHLDDTEIELTASHHGNAISSEWNKRTLLCRWLEESGVDRDYDYILFDCPPATKIVSQNAIAASHGYIIPVVPEAVMERGAPHLHHMISSGIDKSLKALAALGDKRKCYVQNTKLVAVVITRISTSRGYSGYTDDHTHHLYSLQATWGDKLLKPYIVQGTGVSQTLGAGVPVYERSTTQNIGGRGIHTMYRELTDQLKDRIDSQ